ncbi:TPA: VirB4-like conjugal transfer ATPase, CD1110 family [Streptococcus suis]
MGLFNRKGSRKLTKSEKQRANRLRRQMKPSTQNTIKYTSLFDTGLMHITGDRYSRTYRLGDVSYLTAQETDKLDIIESYAEAINALDAGMNYQLTIINRRIGEEKLHYITFEPSDDGFNEYRKELNTIIEGRFKGESNNFEVDKYITISTSATSPKQAQRQLQDTYAALESQFQEVDIELDSMQGMERLQVFSHLLRGENHLTYDYNDIDLSGLTTKSFIAPNRIKFFDSYMQIDHKFAQVLYVRQYPNFLSDKLIKSLTDIGIELAICLHARPYDPSEVLKSINNTDTDIKTEMVKSQKKNFTAGVSEDLAVSGAARETSKATARWREEIVENDQKVFSGLIAVYITGDSVEELRANADKVQTTGRKMSVDFEEIFYHQEEALNTILPIGEVYLNAKKSYMRDMTTANVATQVPFTNVDLHSDSDKALYYGQNQLSNNVITLDRKKDLNTGSGVILGSSGSGKSVTVKAGEVIPTILKYPKDRIVIVDPEDEYSDIGREFGAQMVDISIGSKTNLNLLDLPNLEKLDDEDSDPIGEKSNLLMGLFESVLGVVTDEEFTIIDRVTRETYERYKGQEPTLKEWHSILKEQPEEEAKELALKSEIYATGSQDIFAHKTNIDINERFVIFNLKKLSGKLKPFALMVIQDYIWNQVVEYQGKVTTRIYFDEMQLLFKSQAQAIFFTELYSRVRKYGAIPTGITQNVETLTAREEGRKLLSNSEFIVLLKQKKEDIKILTELFSLTERQIKFVLKPKAKGTGLIIAGSVIVPFENPIPKHTKLFKLIGTDA